MSEKSTIRCYLINEDSNAQVEAEIDLNKPFNVNIIVVAKRIPDFRREFISPEDRFHYLESDALKREFLNTIEVCAVVDDEEVELDCNMTVANAWKKALKGVPLEDGQEFTVLVHGYSRNMNDEMLVPVNEEAGVISQEAANKLIEDNKALLEDKKALQEDKKLLLEEKKLLTRERENLLDERRSLIGENKKLLGEMDSLRKKMDEIQTANTKLAKRPGVGKTVVYVLAGLIVGLLVGAMVITAIMARPEPDQAAPSADFVTETADVSKENDRLKADNEELQKSNDELENKLSEAQKAYDDMVKEKDEKIAKLQAKIDKYEGDAVDDESAEAESAEGSGAAAEGEAAGSSADSGAAAGAESAGAESAGAESAGGSGSANEMKVDSALIMDTDKWVEIISEEDGSGKTVKYSAVSEYKDGVIISFVEGNKSGFSLAVPEGYTTLSFDIGHIMDSGRYNMEVTVLVDGVARDDTGGWVKYTESPRHFDVTGLKAGQVVTFQFNSDTGSWNTAVKYGITNFVLH